MRARFSKFVLALAFLLLCFANAEGITITSPSNESQFLSPANITITVSNSSNDISMVEYYEGSNKIAQSTETPFTVFWTNSLPGAFTLSAKATDTNGVVSFSSPVSIFVTIAGGALSGTFATSPETINLTTEGVTDWAHWGRFTANGFNRKNGVVSQISDIQLVGSSPVYQLDDNSTGYSWSNGTPVAAATNTTTGIYTVGLNEGFEITVPARTNLQTLKLYVGAYGAGGKLMSYLSDYSGSVYIDTNLVNSGNGPNGVYTISFASASPDQLLTVRFTVAKMYDASYGNVTLQAATLDSGNAPPSISLTAPANNAAFSALTDITFMADASDSDGNISQVEFFQGTTSLGAKTSSPYSLIWSNVPAGNYIITAKATDNMGEIVASIPINIFVTLPGGFLAGRVASPPSIVDLTAEGKADWIHWASVTRTNVNRKSGVTPLISTNTQIGSTRGERYFDNPNAYTWSDGMPTTNEVGTTTGLYFAGLGNGFSFTVPADTTLRRLKVYVGVFRAQGKLEATLSDFSAVSFLDSTIISNNSLSAVYTINYAAASAGKKLTVKFTSIAVFDEVDGNVTLQAAALAGSTPVLKIISSGIASFSTELNLNYTVQSTSSFEPANWQTFSNFVGNGFDAMLSLAPFSDPKQFYRVRVTP